MPFSDLPDELWAHVFNSSDAAIVAHDVSHSLHKLARKRLLDELPPSVERQIDAKESFLQSEVCEMLILPAETVRTYPHTERRRFGGGELHLFDSETVYEILEEEGGARAYHSRRDAKIKRDSKKRAREEARPDRIAAAKAKLEAGLRAVGLSLRSDSSLCREYIASGGTKPDLKHVLETMARVHYLHEHTGGAYKKAVEEAVQDRGGHKGYHRGIYRFCAEEVQAESRFRLPSHLPWLPEGANATAEVLDAAQRTADPEAVAKRQKATDLQTRRAAALEKRLAAYAAARRGAPRLKTAYELRDFVNGSGVEFDFGRFFADSVLKSGVGVAQLVELAARLDGQGS
jgi:hypothetical protein